MLANLSPCKAKALKIPAISKAFALTGRLADCHYTQGAALGWELLPFQGVLLSGALGLQLLKVTLASLQQLQKYKK